MPRADETVYGDDAASVLTQVLADGPLWVKQALDRMAEAGFTKDQARRAKDKVAFSVKVGKPGDAEQGWKWQLRRPPEDGSPTPEDGTFQKLPTSPSSATFDGDDNPGQSANPGELGPLNRGELF